jgi:hypothetical protein
VSSINAFAALQTYAEVSATFAGLIAVVIALRGHNERNWTAQELFGAFHVLFPGICAMVFSLVAIALFASLDDETSVWRIAHGLLAVGHLVGPLMFWIQPADSREILSGPLAVIFSTTSALLILCSIAIALGFLLEYAALFYFSTLTLLIFVNIWTFSRMLRSGIRDS